MKLFHHEDTKNTKSASFGRGKRGNQRGSYAAHEYSGGAFKSRNFELNGAFSCAGGVRAPFRVSRGHQKPFFVPFVSSW